jgi:C7-cyclitol 7-kinase
MNVVFDLGGTHLRCAVDCGEPELRCVERSNTSAWPIALRNMRSYAMRTRSEYGEIEYLIVGFPGPIGAGQMPLCAPTVDDYRIELADFADVAPGARVLVLNDVSAAAWYLGSRIGFDRFLVVTVSSGIGAKLYDRSREQPVVDDEPFAGELGHLTVDVSSEAPLCDCGFPGHLGGISSGRGIQRFAQIRAMLDPAAFAASLCSRRSREPQLLTNELDLVPAALAGDAWALSIISDASAPLALALATAVQVCGLQRIVVIGGFACALGETYARLLDRAVRRHLAPEAFGTRDSRIVEVREASDEACLQGAALFGRLQTAHRACAS